MRAEAEKFVAEEIDRLAFQQTLENIGPLAGMTYDGSAKKGVKSCHEIAEPPTSEELVAKTKKFVAEVSDGIDAANKKLVVAVRGMKGKALPLKVSSRPGSAFDPAAMLADINKMISDMYDIELQYRCVEITEDQRDLEQGKVVARVLGYYGGKAVGGLIGACIGGMMTASPAGAPIGADVGWHVGGPIRENLLTFVTDSFEQETREVTRAVRDEFNLARENPLRLLVIDQIFIAKGLTRLWNDWSD